VIAACGQGGVRCTAFDRAWLDLQRLKNTAALGAIRYQVMLRERAVFTAGCHQIAAALLRGHYRRHFNRTIRVR
jgi:hypothetical protein